MQIVYKIFVWGLCQQHHYCSRSTPEPHSELLCSQVQNRRVQSRAAAVSHQSLLSLSWIFTSKPRSRVLSNCGINPASTCEVFWHQKEAGRCFPSWGFCWVIPLCLLYSSGTATTQTPQKYLPVIKLSSVILAAYISRAPLVVHKAARKWRAILKACSNLKTAPALHALGSKGTAKDFTYPEQRFATEHSSGTSPDKMHNGYFSSHVSLLFFFPSSLLKLKDRSRH